MPRDDATDLFETTRGKLLLLMCQGPRTVNELMEALGLTDNAVRAQIANLQQSGLVRQVGLRPGTRKPHADYELTPQARQMFPSAHEPVLRVLVDVMREQLPADAAQSLIREVAQRLLGPWVDELRETEPDRRAAELYRKLRDLAPGLWLNEDPEYLHVSACGCPLASLTALHPEICELLARVLSDVLGTAVRERCDRTETPRCCFSITRTNARPGAA